jgi:hypothetical protein
VLLLVLTGAAVAQTTRVTEPMVQSALERSLERVADDVGLLRLSLGVRIEPRAARWVVSLIDLTTGRLAASTEIELPTDRDEAVAVLVREIVALKARAAERRVPEEPVTPPEEQEDQSPALLSNEERVERAQHRAAELVFRQHSLRFGPSYKISGQHTYGVTGQQWHAFRGRIDQELEAREFYQAIGRDDLGHAYQRRRALMIGSFFASTLAFIAAGVLIFENRPNLDSCNGLQGQAQAHCIDTRITALSPMTIAAGCGMAAMALSFYFHRNPHPIDENDAKTLADAYNQRLRRRLGLPVAIRRPILHHVTLRPYVAERDAGLALGGRFR